MATKSVLSETNYSLFKIIEGNREIRPSKVSRIKSSVKRHGLLQPAIVNSNYELLDGQHRYIACKELGIPFEFIIRDDISLEKIQEMNSVQDKWKLSDFIESYASLGNQNYKNFLKLQAIYAGEFDSSALLAVTSPKMYVREVADGKLFFNESMLASVQNTFNSILEVKQYFKDANKLKFVRAYRRALAIPEFKHSEFISKLSQQRSSLYPCMRDSQYLELIEKIYNYRRRRGFEVFLTR